MTREELLQHLEAWRTPSRMTRRDFGRRDALQFALWWYGKSTEADTDNPIWPSEDYITSKLGGGPFYLSSIDAAATLIPRNIWLEIHTGTQLNGPSWGWPVIKWGNQETGAEFPRVHAQTLPVALCIVAISARLQNFHSELNVYAGSLQSGSGRL